MIKNKEKRIGKGFNDLKSQLITIPVIAFIVTLFIYDFSSFKLEVYLAYLGFSFLYTTTLWVSTTKILVLLHTKYPDDEDTAKRLSRIALAIIMNVILISVIVQFFISTFLVGESYTIGKVLNSVKINIIPTTIVVAIYEVIFFMDKFKESKQEATSLRETNLKQQLDSLKDQISPHFLFNSLNTLSSLIEDRPEIATQFVQELSDVYRYLLSSRDQELIPLHKELDFINAYTFLISIRFGEQFTLEVAIPEELEDYLIPPLTLQLLVENAIKHNIITASKPLQVRIYNDSYDFLVVRNNIQKKLGNIKSEGKGLENIRKRYALLNDKKVDVLITSNDFVVRIPLIKEHLLVH